jgi:biopolymer transport protein ExbD
VGIQANAESDDIAPMSAINVTPFVDVVLVLLVIFMVTAPILMKDTLGIKLPRSSSSDQKTSSSVGIAVTRDGAILVNGTPATPDAVASAVRAALVADPNAQAIISADADARHGAVVQAIDLVKSAGMDRFALQIEKP